ncbi:S1 family peptidase [Aeoliella mucimassa]|uniref:Periplasmic serine endoprotease DegP n=1 Tax=Aeoliella mucimassa TaxID=2527972 RepID=A0A518AM78_9BACT|nr:serine protease [Aeoliella mucimassa]QDU55833.1 Periplasmic serine endoprotease DegP precursor [Aeoliella mucimassa]
MRYLLFSFICLTTAALPLAGRAAPNTPHPAVVRVVTPESDGTAYGSGTLIDARDEYGLVLTNWHVVRDATGPIEVRFPSGFTSQARAIKMDSEWDLAALVVWRPDCEPVKLAARPPRPGEPLTICGYGSGIYRSITGRCTQYYAPRLNLPQELVELDVQARQGDSGGPIFNARGELAGVLFGAGQGTTLGSFEGRVKTFLASLGPDVGRHSNGAPQIAMRSAAPPVCPTCPQATNQWACQDGRCMVNDDLGNVCFGCDQVADHETPTATKPLGTKPAAKPPTATENAWPDWRSDERWSVANQTAPPSEPWPRFDSDQEASEPPAESGPAVAEAAPAEPAVPSSPLLSGGLFDNLRNGLAVVGVLAIVLQLMKLAS